MRSAFYSKHRPRVQEENQTLATITLQNFFRLYEKLGGMTGTALTEATEFMKIYKLPVVQVPTNRDMVRQDKNDQVYKTKEGKWHAVAEEVTARHNAGQPVLVGTISVEVSELLSEELRKRGVPHTVLNAKPEYAEREGEIVAEAGRPGAVTIATNMAGRGVDIKLGGNAEHLTELELAKLGLKPRRPRLRRALRRRPPRHRGARRGRTARRSWRPAASSSAAPSATSRGASTTSSAAVPAARAIPGESRFFLSAEDDLVRLFAGDRIYRILDRLGETDEDGHELPIEAGILSKQIEKAQRKVEEQNFLIRKRVLEYDDVMNEQRRIVYAYRDEVLEGKDMGDTAREEIASVIRRLVEDHTPGDYTEEWDLDGLFIALDDIFPPGFGPDEIDETADREGVIDGLTDDADALYDRREAELGDEIMRALERYLLLNIIDQRWREHLYDMDYLREGIHLRGFAQIDPLVAYKNEAFELFSDLMATIWSDFARMVFNVPVEIEEAGGQENVVPEQPRNAPGARHDPRSCDVLRRRRRAAVGPDRRGCGERRRRPRTPRRRSCWRRPSSSGRLNPDEQIGRNDPCWCGSGKKYKKCHGS